MSAHNKLVIMDQMMSQLDAARPGIVPGSVVQAVQSGIQNAPATIVQHNIDGLSNSAYTTFPLSPIIKNCCLDKTYLNLEFEINFGLKFKTEDAAAAVITQTTQSLIIPFYFGFRDTANIFNQLQILEENAAIWTTVYNREESTLAYCSLPETEIRGNNQYSSIEKMRTGARSPMKRILLKYSSTTASLAQNTEATVYTTVHFKCTVDINRLTPLISNLHFTTPHFGNLRLKVFLQEIQKALFFCPDYSFYAPIKTSSGIEAGHLTGSNACDLINQATFQPIQNQYWSFYPLNQFLGNNITSDMIPFYGYTHTNATAGEYTYCQLLQSVQFVQPSGNTDFMTFSSGIAEIVQTCFDMEESEYQRLTDYFASIGSIIIPSQVWSTQPFNNSAFGGGISKEFNKGSNGDVNGYNINFLSVFTTPTNSPCCFCPEFYTQTQLLLEGRPVNAMPYVSINDKAIVDTTQAIIDTDHEEINADYMASLNFMNLTEDDKYVDETPQNLYGTGTKTSASLKNIVSNPNLYALNFSTNLPDAFHSGAAILEKSTRNALLRFNSSSALDTNALLYGSSEANSKKFPYVINHKNTTCNLMFSSLCDCCIVLDYDAARGTCFNGSMSWAAPYN